MADLQLLDVPMCRTPMTVSVSLKGITLLKDSKFKRRHSGSKLVVQQPITGFKDLRVYKKEWPQEFLKPKKRTKKNKSAIEVSATPAQQPTTKKPRYYVIDKKQVTHRILNYVNSMKGEKLLFFWTVTFPKGTPDNSAYKLFNTWLTRLRKEGMLKEYLWIAERQKIGTVHFHMVINRRMDVKKANRYMRAAIFNAIDRKEVVWNRTDAAKYNGVDISKNRKTGRVTNFAKKKNQKALSNYLTKYVSKSQDKFTHLAWHNSREYSGLVISVNLTDSEFKSSKLLGFCDQTKPLDGQYFIFYRWKGDPPNSVTNYLSYANQIIMSLTGEN